MTLDVTSNSFFTSKYKAIRKENPVVNQKSLKVISTHPLKYTFDFTKHVLDVPQSSSVVKIQRHQ